MARTLIDALLVERTGYANRGLVDRVAQVDAALRELGFVSTLTTVEAAAITSSAERATRPKSRKRRV